MDYRRSKEKELAKELISLDLDEGIRIEQQPESSDAELLEFVKSKFNKNFSITLY